MSDWGPPYGFAIRRNGSCLPEERTSFRTWNLTSNSEYFYQCCPETETPIQGPEQPGVCCPYQGNCTQLISNPVHCANETWDLYKNDVTDGNGHFCCEQGMTGFVRTGSGVGCAVKGDYRTPNTGWLDPETPSAATTSTSSSSKTGAIAGGVVGGVAGLAIIVALLWYLMRRRSQKQSPPEESPFTDASGMQPDPIQSSDKPSELDGRSYVAELENTPVYELPGNPRTR